MSKQTDIIFSIVVIALMLPAVFPACSGDKPLRIIDRETWGSQPVIDAGQEQQIKYITIHHGGVTVASDTNPELYLRNLQNWSRTEKGWSDIPYHYLIDFEGRVYEGRPALFPGDTNTDYDTRGHLLICVIGNYEEQEFFPVQYDALVNLLCHFCSLYNVDPHLIKGHKDYTETACPGKNLYQYLESGRLIEDVEKKLPHLQE